jgi:hypothetical protein
MRPRREGMRKLVVIAVLAGALGFGAVACTPPWEGSIRDLEDAEVRDADVTVYNNINRHPNIARVCTDGVAWVTTSREFDSLERMEDWDELCPNRSDIVAER